MKTTEKKYWRNGYQLRGGWHKTYTLSLFNYGVMFAWGKLPNGYRKDKLTITLYKLI